MSVKTLVAYGYSERQFKEMTKALSQILTKHGLPFEPAKWPHISIISSLIDLDEEQTGQALDIAKRGKGTLPIKNLEVFVGKFTGKLWIVLELEATGKFVDTYHKLENMIGKDNTVQYPIRPHTSLAAIDIAHQDKLNEILPDIKTAMKRYLYPVTPNKAFTWKNFEVDKTVVASPGEALAMDDRVQYETFGYGPGDYGIEDYSWEGDKLNVKGAVFLADHELTELPFKFGAVTGSFYCNNNQLTSLRGAPERVGGGFYCQGNFLTSLHDAPKRVGKSFICSSNHLSSLQGAPRIVREDFLCARNRLESLLGAPDKVGGNFYCGYNRLISLDGVPKTIGGEIDCGHNPNTPIELIKSLLVNGEMPDRHLNIANKIDPQWRTIIALEEEFKDMSDDSELLNILEDLSK